MTLRPDFTSQEYFRNPAVGIEKLRTTGPVVEVSFPIVGKVWITTTHELASHVLKDSETFTLRKDSGTIAGLRWWMPGLIRAVADNMLTRMEGKCALQALFRRRPNLELAVADSQIRWRERPGLRAIASLPVVSRG